MTVSAVTDWSYRGFQAVILENSLLRAVILPELGAKIWQLTYKPQDVHLLWHNPRIKPRAVAFGASYDDHFFGGWDELFPNDMPETINGEAEPDHGEIWALSWNFSLRQSADEAELTLWVDTPISACRVEKRIVLRDGESRLRFRHRLTNTGLKPLPFLWKLHAAMNVHEYSRLDAGAKSVYIEDFGLPRTGRTKLRYEWPYAPGEDGVLHDMRSCLPPSSGVGEFQYVTELAAGWCALTDTKTGVGFGLAFDKDVFRSCWFFASYGGWRNLQTLVLEPCTGYPVSVNDGIAAGTHQTLGSGETLETEVTAVIYAGMKAIRFIDLDGNVDGIRMEEEGK